VFGLPPSPSLEWVHASAGLSRRFRTWFDKACKNYGELLELGGVVANVLRRERREELTGEERTKFTDALMEYGKLEDGLSKFAKLKSFTDFVSFTDENLIKWVGDEILSLGYCGFRERSSQYWLGDYRAEKLPYEHKVREVFAFYGLETRLQIYGLRIPSQEQAESWLFEFLENIKKWPRERLVWLIRNRYPLTDDTGGFWAVVRKIVELQSLKDVWDDFLSDWHSTVQGELKKMPQFEVLKTVLLSEWEAGNYVRDVVDEVKKELVEKYAERVADPDDVKSEFLARAKEVFLQRVTPESKIIEAYEEVKSLVPAEKLELTKAGLAKAIRWAFLHPQISLETFASGQVFPLGFTTEQAREIATKIFEKVPKKPVVAPSIRAYWGTSPRGLPALWVEVYVEGKLKVRGHLEVRRETRETLEKIVNDKIKGSVVDAGLPEDILLVDPLLKETTDLVKTLLETAPPEVLAPPIKVTSIGSDYVHDSLVAEGWKPIISIPRLEEALKALGTGGHSTPELALEVAKREYSPEVYEFKVVKHYALHGEFPYTVFVREKKPPVAPPPPTVPLEQMARDALKELEEL